MKPFNASSPLHGVYNIVYGMLILYWGICTLYIITFIFIGIIIYESTIYVMWARQMSFDRKQHTHTSYNQALSVISFSAHFPHERRKKHRSNGGPRVKPKCILMLFFCSPSIGPMQSIRCKCALTAYTHSTRTHTWMASCAVFFFAHSVHAMFNLWIVHVRIWNSHWLGSAEGGEREKGREKKHGWYVCLIHRIYIKL